MIGRAIPEQAIQSAIAGAAPMEAGLAASQAAQTESWTPFPAADASRQVLVIEPDPRARSLLELALNREGFKTLTARTADEGLSYLGPDRPLPAAVVSEAQLPGADGFAFCGRLRADRRTARMPFILLSESANTRQVELATGVGADDFVIKPTYVRDVASLVRLKAGAIGSDSSFRAHTDALPLPELLRALLSGVRSGKVEVEHEGGEIAFQRGRLVDASLRDQRGLSALLPILLLADGAYAITFTGMLEEGSFSLTLEELCRNILPSIWQWRRHVESGVHLSSRLVVDFGRFRELLPEIPVAVSDVIRLFDGHRAVREIVMDSSLDEVTTFAAISRLHKMGVLVPWTATAKPKLNHGLAIAKKLFKHKTSVDPVSAASKQSQVDSGKHYEDLGLLLLREEGPAAVSHSGAQKAFNAAAAVIGAVMVAAGASWVVARGHPGSSLFSWARRSAAAKSQPSPPAPVAPGASSVPQLGAASTNAERWFDVERTLGTSRITPTTQAQSAPDFWLITALARFQSGDKEGAKAAAHHALELDPRNGGAAVLLGTLHLDDQEQVEAERELQRYLELEPEGAYADQARQLLKSP